MPARSAVLFQCGAEIMTVYDENNVFARILREEIPCKVIYEDAYALGFHDIHPKAPVHVLVIPKGKYVDIADFCSKANAGEVTGFWRAVSKVCADLGLENGGFRIIANAGSNGGQEVPHFHIHILGGRSLGPMLAQAA